MKNQIKLGLLLLAVAFCIIASTMPVLSFALHPAADTVTTDIIANDYESMIKLSLDERTAIADKAINDYLSGKTSELVIPGAKIVSVPSTPLTTPPVDHLPPRPDYSNATVTKSGSLTVQSGGLPYRASPSPDYAATYIGCGGPSTGHYTVSGDAHFNYDYNAGLANLIPGEIFVMHLWGNNLNGGAGTEDNIVIGKNQGTGLIDFTRYMNGFPDGNPWRGTIASLPADHRIAMYIKAKNPSGRNYNQVEFDVFDVTSWTDYIKVNNTPQTQVASDGDMALEKQYGLTEQRPGPLNQWKIATAYHAYDSTSNVMNLAQTGHVFEYYTNGVSTAYYYDFYPYGYPQQIPNAEGQFFFTRYLGSYPPHP